MSYSEHKPWYREDMGRIFAATYFLAQSGKNDPKVRFGIALVVSSLCLTFGVDPMSFMKPEDARLLKEGVK